MVIKPIVGVYIPIIRLPIKGGMTIPNIGSLDPGTVGGLFEPILVKNVGQLGHYPEIIKNKEQKITKSSLSFEV